MTKEKTGLSIDRRNMLVGLGGMAALSGCSFERKTLISADAHPADYPTVQAVGEMARLLSEYTKGEMKVKSFAGGQLGSERDTLEITSFGGIDFNRVNLAPLNAIEPLTSIASLPFLFKTTQHMRDTLDGEIGDAILASLEPHGLIGLCFYDSGERCFYNTRKPIRTPDDMKGMKIRVQNSDLYVSMIKALGADATPMSLGEVYQSLIQGVIDGAENNWPSYENGRHFEAAPFYSLTRHVMTPEILVMSANRWNKLSSENQAHVKKAARESVGFMRNLWDARVIEAKERVLAAGVQANEVDDITQFSALMRPVWDKFVKTDQQKELMHAAIELGNSYD